MAHGLEIKRTHTQRLYKMLMLREGSRDGKNENRLMKSCKRLCGLRIHLIMQNCPFLTTQYVWKSHRAGKFMSLVCRNLVSITNCCTSISQTSYSLYLFIFQKSQYSHSFSMAWVCTVMFSFKPDVTKLLCMVDI